MTNILKIEEKKSRFLRNPTQRLTRWCLGLLLGSLRGTFLDCPCFQKWWDGSLIVFILFLRETTSWVFYSNRKLRMKIRRLQNIDLNHIISLCQTRKIGLLFAIFLDAFKVGS